MENLSKVFGFTAALLFTQFASASDNYSYVCIHGTSERVIEVNYSQGTPVPCEVVYKKAEGAQVLWNAENNQGYCESKAEAFVEKQRGWGWTCEMASGSEQSASAEDIDNMPPTASGATDEDVLEATEEMAETEMP